MDLNHLAQVQQSNPEYFQHLQQLLRLHHDWSQQMQKSVATALTDPKPEEVAEVGADSFAVADTAWSDLQKHLNGFLQKTACQKGCGWCCHLHVEISWAEALAIAVYLRVFHFPVAFDDLRHRIQQTAARLSSLDAASRIPHKIPCAFLGADQTCQIYDYRPLPCRGFNSLDATICEQGFGISEAGTPLESWQTTLYSAILTGLRQGCEARGVHSELIEFHSALSKAFEFLESSGFIGENNVQIHDRNRGAKG